MKKTLLRKFYQKIILVAIIFFTSCTSSGQNHSTNYQLTDKEKHELNLFFKHLLLREEGIYVLFGSKPLIVCQTIYMSEHEQDKEFEKLEKTQRDSIVKVKIAFDFQWWENVTDRLKTNQYLIFQKDTSHPKVKDVFFVNILNTALFLQKNYDLFRRAVGHDFSPLDIVFDIEKDSSDFWKKVFGDSMLLGIIYGYGVDNACLFSWIGDAEQSSFEKKQNYGHSLSKIFMPTISKHEKKLFLSDSTDNILNYQDFPLPCFRALKGDLQKKKYLKEQKQIKAIYKGKDPLEVTLQKLCQ